jgi:hypothetical protein
LDTQLPPLNDPDFIPEEQMKGQQTADQDPDFIPEEAVKKDPSLLQKGIDILAAEFPTVTSGAKKLGEKFNSALEDVFSNPALQYVDPVNKMGLTLQNTAQSIFDEGGEKTAERLAANGMNPYRAALAGTGIAMFPDLVFTVEGIGAMRAAGNVAAESKMLQNVMGKLKTAAPLQIGYEAPIATPLGEIVSKEAISLESKAQSLLKGKAPLALPEPKVVQGPKQTVSEKFGISSKEVEGIKPTKVVRGVFENRIKGFKKTGTPGIKIDKGIYEQVGNEPVTHKVSYYDENGKIAAVAEIEVVGKEIKHITAGTKPGSKPMMGEFAKKLQDEGYSLGKEIVGKGTLYSKSGKKTLARILSEEAGEPGFTMTDQPDLAKIQQSKSSQELSSLLEEYQDRGVPDEIELTSPDIDIHQAKKIVGEKEFKTHAAKMYEEVIADKEALSEDFPDIDFENPKSVKDYSNELAATNIITEHNENLKNINKSGKSITEGMQRGAQPTYPEGMKGPVEKKSSNLYTLQQKKNPEQYVENYGNLEEITNDPDFKIPKAGIPGFQTVGPEVHSTIVKNQSGGSTVLHISDSGKLDAHFTYTYERGGKVDSLIADLESPQKSKLTNDFVDYLKKQGLDVSNFKKIGSDVALKIKPGESLKQYAARKKLSADVPDFKDIHANEAVAPADYNNPAITDMMDESRAQYSGVDSRLKMETDAETGRTMFKLREDPPKMLGVATEAEVASNQTTKNSVVVKELGIDPRMVDSTPLLTGSDQVPVLKPEIVAGSRSWIHSAWNRIGAASEAVVSRMGVAGKELAQAIRTVRDVPQVRYGEFSADFDKFLKGMSKYEARTASEELTAVLEGRVSKNINAKKLPDGLVDFVRQKLKVIADEAASVEMKITNSKGESVPFAPRENFFPRVVRQEILDGLISGDNKVMSQVAEAMVKNRQESSYARALDSVKGYSRRFMQHRFGHLERAREFDLPSQFYDKNSLRVIPEYMRTALHRIEEVRQFGLLNEKAIGMYTRISEEGFDGNLAGRIYERFIGTEPRDTIKLKGYQGLRNLTAGMLIQAQSNILQLGQVLTPAFEAGFIKAAKGFAKAWTALGEDEAKRAAQLFSNTAIDYVKEGYGGGYGFAGKFADKMLNITGFTRTDHLMRKYSAIVGKDYIGSLVTKLLKNNRSKEALVELQHLGFDTDKIIRNKGISVLEHNVGAKNFADNTQGAPDVTRLPYYWTSPGGKVFAQFKNFSYLIGKENASLIKRALQTGNVTRLGEMAFGLPLSGYAIKSLRDAMAGESNSEVTGQEDVDALIQVLANATAFGPTVDLFLLALQGSHRLESFFVPIGVKNITEIVGAAGKSIKEMDIEPFLKTATKKLPVAGRIIANQIWGE